MQRGRFEAKIVACKREMAKILASHGSVLGYTNSEGRVFGNALRVTVGGKKILDLEY